MFSLPTETEFDLFHVRDVVKAIYSNFEDVNPLESGPFGPVPEGVYLSVNGHVVLVADDIDEVAWFVWIDGDEFVNSIQGAFTSECYKKEGYDSVVRLLTILKEGNDI